MEIEKKYLPPEILNQSINNEKEYGWYRQDFLNVIETATKIGLAIVGGQIQFKLPDGTCELYWHKYDTTDRKSGENWKDYCQRTKDECLAQFERIPTNKELIKDGIGSFDFLKEKSIKGLNLEKYLIFIIYFDDTETKNQ